MRRRDFITLIGGGAATTWVHSAHAQSSLPVIGFIDAGSTKRNPELMAACVRGLAENGIVVDRDFTIESRSGGGDERMLPSLVNDLVPRNVTVITTPAGAAATMAAK